MLFKTFAVALALLPAAFASPLSHSQTGIKQVFSREYTTAVKSAIAQQHAAWIAVESTTFDLSADAVLGKAINLKNAINAATNDYTLSLLPSLQSTTFTASEAEQLIEDLRPTARLQAATMKTLFVKKDLILNIDDIRFVQSFGTALDALLAAHEKFNKALVTQGVPQGLFHGFDRDYRATEAIAAVALAI